MTDHSDIEAVRDVLRQVYAAWADNDVDAFAAQYAEDVTIVTPSVFHPNRAALHAFMTAAFAGPLKGTRPVDKELSVRVLGAFAVVITRSIIMRADESGIPEDADARTVTATWIVARTDGGWKIAAYANAPA
ncbi:SgcJ/EcaC family oxidoreductase [Actinocrispum wychmicini]|uniref:Uncharacterized protein (TIGR02246 family) n=1 Tax=Actinocrispum wychmicini TaxID=1213861 RepID=A0A4R2KEX9_9PSEU|nr:SgcJ/EcaC family oxidoreductase [Actinocrispum wychmicini]TCO65105.1 uncharacterized protein (TIGR02246 family) [Actinocrispum wychmicini]